MAEEKTGLVPKDRNPEYWEKYSNHQRVKHQLIHEYLNGWFAKLGMRSGRILYFDTHAGKGKHASGDLGSPLVAMTTLLQHRFWQSHFSTCEIRFFFIDEDPSNAAVLRREITALGALPSNVTAEVIEGDCFRVLDGIVGHLREKGQIMAPAFVFVDPYGFKIPGETLRRLMEFRRVELFINVMWHELNWSFAHAVGDQPGSWPDTLNSIFGSDEWRSLVPLQGEDRAEGAIELFRKLTDAKWATRIRMLGRNNATRYFLVHFTNHETGRDLMKACVWKVCPEGGFLVRLTDDARQPYLITPEPNLVPLRQWVIDRLGTSPRRWKSLIEDVRPEIWIERHLNQVIRDLKATEKIGARGYQGRCVPSSNPELFLLK